MGTCAGNQNMILCYTGIMLPDRNLWPDWARILQRWGMQNLASFFLEAGGPVNVLAAQVIYLGQPFLKGVAPSNNLRALAALLEDQDAARQFAVFLREGK
jgi:hypothetical protein